MVVRGVALLDFALGDTSLVGAPRAQAVSAEADGAGHSALHTGRSLALAAGVAKLQCFVGGCGDEPFAVRIAQV